MHQPDGARGADGQRAPVRRRAVAAQVGERPIAHRMQPGHARERRPLAGVLGFEALLRLSDLPFVPKALQRGEQRRAFLSDPTHKHVFHFTPKHGSWLNQVELWFSVLARRFLKRGDFGSPEDFASRLTDYLDVYNTHHAHPYRWTYTGQPLVRATPFSQTRRQQRHGRAWLSSRPKRFARALSPPRPYKRSAARLAAHL